MKFLVENELEKRHKKHKKTIKPGAMGSFIHPDGGNQVAIDTFNNSVDMGAVSCDAMSEELNEDYAANKLMKLISIQYPVEKDDNIQLFTTPRGNYLVKVNGKSLLTLGKENFRESDIENLRLDGYFTDYDELRMNGDLDESIETYINKEDKVTKSKFLKEFKDYPVGTYIRLCAKGNINDISQYTYGKVKTKDNEWAAYSSFYGIQDTTCDDQHIIDLIDRKNIKNIGVKLPKQNQAINEALDNGNDPHKNVDLGYIKGTHWGVSVYDKTGNIYLNQYHPYDNAPYCWAYSTDKGKTFIIVRDRKVLETFKADPKEKYQDIISRMSYLDKNTKSRMLYNSFNTKADVQNNTTNLNEELKDDINAFIEDSRGYSDYNQIIDDVADEFNLSKKEAENYVWEYFYSEGHSVENSYNESYEDASYYTDIEILAQKQGRADRVQEKELKSKKDFIDTFDFNIYDDTAVDSEEKEAIYNLYKAAYNKERKFKDGRFFPQLEETFEFDLADDALYALRNFKKHAQNGDELKIDINGNKGEVSKEADGWYLYYGGLVTQGSYKIIEAAIKDILNRNSEKDVFLSEDYSKEEKRSDFIKALKLCAAYDPNTLYIDNYSQKQAAEAKNKEINTAFDKIMMKYNVKSTGVPAECTNLKSESDYINKLKQYIAKNKKVMKESFDPYSIEYWNYEPDEIEVGIEYCENNYIDPTSLTPTDFENIVILANGYYPHDEGWKYTDAEILSALDYILEKGMMLSSLTPENFEEVIKKANALDECAKMTNKEIKEDVPGGQYYWPGSEEEWESEEDIYGDEEIPFDDSLEKSCDMKESRMTNKEIKEALNKLDMWAIDNDTTFYDLKTLYEAFVNPNSPVDQKKKEKIQKALNDPTLNKDKEKLQDYISGVLSRQEESLGEALEDQAIIPKPYNEYFEIDTINVSDDDFYDYKPGDEIDGYDCHFIAYLIPKTEEVEDIYPVLTDDPKYPVCELIAGRLIPVDLPENL